MKEIEKKIDSIRDELLQLQVMIDRECGKYQETDWIYKRIKTASWFVGDAYWDLDIVSNSLALAKKGE